LDNFLKKGKKGQIIPEKRGIRLAASEKCL